jgi:hypothetical protein
MAARTPKRSSGNSLLNWLVPPVRRRQSASSPPAVQSVTPCYEARVVSATVVPDPGTTTECQSRPIAIVLPRELTQR